MIQAQAVQWRNHQAQLQAVQQAEEHHSATTSDNGPSSISSRPSRGRSRERGRDRSTNSEIGTYGMDQRRRAQSKSPARQRSTSIINGSANGRKYVDLEEYERVRGRADSGTEPQSLLSSLGIGKRIRVIGDAVRHVIGGTRKSVSGIDVTDSEAKVTLKPVSTPNLHLKSNLKKHMWFHLVKKDYKCKLCIYSGADVGCLNTHMKIHIGNKVSFIR